MPSTYDLCVDKLPNSPRTWRRRWWSAIAPYAIQCHASFGFSLFGCVQTWQFKNRIESCTCPTTRLNSGWGWLFGCAQGLCCCHHRNLHHDSIAAAEPFMGDDIVQGAAIGGKYPPLPPIPGTLRRSNAPFGDNVYTMGCCGTKE